MTMRAEGLPPKTNFDLFVVQLPNSPFGLAWYQNDFETGGNGQGSVTVRGRFNIETFSPSHDGPAGGSDPRVKVTGPAVNTNVVFRASTVGVRSGRVANSGQGVSAETGKIRRAITLLEQATIDEPPEYWQALLDELAPLVDLEVPTSASIAFEYVVALRDRTDSARTPQDRAARIAAATMFLRQPHQFPR